LGNCEFPENYNEMKKKEKKRREKRGVKGGSKQQENLEGS
jgi:hypothetical protein